MTSLQMCAFAVAISCACSTTPPEQVGRLARSVESLTTTQIPGFNHTIATTKFQIGGPAPASVVAQGMTKWVGSTGVFSVNNANGASYGVMNGVKSGGVPFAPYTGGMPAHEALVQAYFTGAGLPADQVGPLRTNVTARGSGPGDTPPVMPTTFGFSSIVTRSVNGFRVAESRAWARLDVSGAVVAESVYWPQLDASVIADASTLSNTLASPSLAAAYFASLPVSSDIASTGSVIIHHSSEFVETAFQDVACYDVWFGPPVQGEGVGWTRHFDKTGAEVRLPQELRTGHPASRP